MKDSPVVSSHIEPDFLHNPTPEAVEVPELDITSSARFFNRELSWLAFNTRVLEEAQNPRLPLLERVKMLSISGTNLDEFYTVRVAGLREMVRNNIQRPALDGKTPQQQLDAIDLDARCLMQTQQDVWVDLMAEIKRDGIDILTRDKLSEEDRAHLKQVFVEQIFPILTPLAIDPAHPFPFIPNTGLTLALELRRKKDKRVLQSLLPIPAQVQRFVALPDGLAGTQRLIMLEEVLLEFLDQLFPGYGIVGHCSFRLLRDSDLELEDEAEDLVREFETALKRRRRGEVIRMTLSTGAPSGLTNVILESLGLKKSDVIEVDGLLGVSDLAAVILDSRADLQWQRFKPRVPERVQDFEGDIFAAIRQKDMLLHHPYETFDIVVEFLRQAARDPDVVAIKQTLYRTSNESPIVEALCEAAENGKSVTALVELKARFDEAANIRQSRRLERAGAHVVYGFIDLKTHAKLSTVVRREGDALVTYTHFGTGNYHPITAKFYTDLSFFTCDRDLGHDATKVFNYISGYVQPEGLSKLSVSPLYLKNDLLGMIQNEVDAVAQGKPGTIWAKMNALIDGDVIDALYRASQAGVKIDLVVRGICGLRPGIKGLSDNIRVKSIVGRFLEHSRIVCFGNGFGLPSKNAKVFMSSADWMGRNLKRRVESLVPITNKTVHAQIMSQIMAANLADQVNSWVLQPDGTYVRDLEGDGSAWFNCHKFFMENPSLSGRGSVGAKDVPKLMHSNEG
ncbi:RNA degradosome polyphosphate kinase [Amylibacter sp. IMCC11727]|uniref:RNA degradosome polyphosphate kinase n=1 Tax=Amylibacter sp. IMCC11727 TaxID=3039851 RepID=UPI00244E0D6C|nr:RNA degradosome polyphosphate kinase [Amylibacter sp. IMCC11727]WGI22908.1 RNA degradosome polyphosphate kinase [Amylibacter sp. IMCC11727]